MRSIAACLLAMLAGCMPEANPGPRWRPLAAFPSEDAVPRVTVHRGLREVLPRYDATSPLEYFLYGPSDFGHTGLRNAQGMALLGHRLLVCDQGLPGMVAISLRSGQSVPWGERGRAPRCPVDVAVDEEMHVYVADTTRQAVLMYDAQGRFLQELTPDTSLERAFRPTSVACGGDVLYVGDTGQRRVERWSRSSRQWLDPLTAPADRPPIVAPTGLCVASGVLHVADAVQGCVHRITADGHWLAPIGRRGRGPGELVRPKQVACTPSGLVFVVDAGRQSVQVFDVEGRPVTEVHERAGQWPGWTLPGGLLVVGRALIATERDGDEAEPPPEADEWVVVSDTMGAVQLTLLGVFNGRREQAHAR